VGILAVPIVAMGITVLTVLAVVRSSVAKRVRAHRPVGHQNTLRIVGRGIEIDIGTYVRLDDGRRRPRRLDGDHGVARL
jgi:hypothetical protein